MQNMREGAGNKTTLHLPLSLSLSLSLTGYGKVFLVRMVNGNDKGRLFAMKVLKKATIVRKRKVMEHTLTERSVLEAIRDFPFLVTLHYAFQTNAKLHLIMGELSHARAACICFVQLSPAKLWKFFTFIRQTLAASWP